MVQTRSSTNSSPPSSQTHQKAYKKRPANTSSLPTAKRGRPSTKKNESPPNTEDKSAKKGDDGQQVLTSEGGEMGVGSKKDSKKVGNGKDNDRSGDLNKEDENRMDVDTGNSGEGATTKGEQNGDGGQKKPGEGGKKNAFDEVKADPSEVQDAAHEEEKKKEPDIAKDNKSIIEDSKRETKIPTSILEKGFIYLFFRPRVNVDDPRGVKDVARSYMVLRPVPLGAKLGDGPLEDLGNSRLLVLPKKILPKSSRDRFLVFVEKTKAHIKDLREQFKGSEYATKTTGTSTTEPAAPFAEGIYAITSTGRESHLAYHITAPSPLGDIQKQLGLKEKSSFVASVKNPQTPAPANASLPKGAEYPEEVQERFRGLSWMPLEPELLEHENAQCLIIGEGFGQFGRAVEEQSRDEKDGAKEKPEEELEKLEEEDHHRVEHLKEDDPVFADLGLSAKEYPKMQTTW